MDGVCLDVEREDAALCSDKPGKKAGVVAVSRRGVDDSFAGLDGDRRIDRGMQVKPCSVARLILRDVCERREPTNTKCGCHGVAR